MTEQQHVTEHRNYEAIAKKLLGLDSYIISVTISSFVGEIMNIKYAPIGESLKPDDRLLEKAGSLVAMVAAIVNQGEAPYGACQYVIIIRQNQGRCHPR